MLHLAMSWKKKPPVALASLALAAGVLLTACTAVGREEPPAVELSEEVEEPTPTPSLDQPVVKLEDDAAPDNAIDAPPGLFYRDGDGLWQVLADGTAQQLTGRSNLTLSPDGRRALSVDDEGRMWLVDFQANQEQPLDLGVRPVGVSTWIDNDTFLMGFWNVDDEGGPNAGRLGIYELASGTFTDLETGLTGAPPAVSPDGQTIAYNTFDSAYLLKPGEAPEVFDMEQFAGWPAGMGLYFGTAAWSADGERIAWILGGGFGPDGSYRLVTAVFDLVNESVTLLHPYEPVGFGGWMTAPVWSPDGFWLAQMIVANVQEEAGLWLMRADGSAERRIGDRHLWDPTWMPDSRRLLYTTYVPDMPGGISLYDRETNVHQALALPDGVSLVRFLTP